MKLIKSYPTSHSKEEDFEFEKKYIPIVQKELTTIFTKLHDPNKCTVTITAHENKKDMDKFLAIDARVETENLPSLTIQIKGRRYPNYEKFKIFQDMLISYSKTYPRDNEFITIKCGDYFKCNADYYFYFFANKDITGIEYWAILDWNRIKLRFIDFKGWNNISNINLINFPDTKTGVITTCLEFPWKYAKNYLKIDKNLFYNNTLLFEQREVCLDWIYDII